MKVTFVVFLRVDYIEEMDTTEKQSDPDTARASVLAADLRILIGQLKRRLREEVHPGALTWSQMAVLGRLEREGPATVTTLARADGVRPQSMGATVAVLEAAGLVTGTPDPADGRQTILSISPACREMILSTRAAREDWLYRAIRTKLAAAEQDELAAGIALLKRLLDA
jgi:DNA-binding MarR family transcriptional regulator